MLPNAYSVRSSAMISLETSCMRTTSPIPCMQGWRHTQSPPIIYLSAFRAPDCSSLFDTSSAPAMLQNRKDQQPHALGSQPRMAGLQRLPRSGLSHRPCTAATHLPRSTRASSMPRRSVRHSMLHTPVHAGADAHAVRPPLHACGKHVPWHYIQAAWPAHLQGSHKSRRKRVPHRMQHWEPRQRAMHTARSCMPCHTHHPPSQQSTAFRTHIVRRGSRAGNSATCAQRKLHQTCRGKQSREPVSAGACT